MEIRGEKLQIAYGDYVAVSEMDIHVQKGKVTSIIGPNGSGKSTVLKGLTRLLGYKSGAVYLDDRDLKEFTTKELARRIGVLPQIHSAPPDFQVKELVGYGRMPYQKWYERNSDEDKKIIDWAMKATGVWHLKEKSINECSGGAGDHEAGEEAEQGERYWCGNGAARPFACHGSKRLDCGDQGRQEIRRRRAEGRHHPEDDEGGLRRRLRHRDRARTRKTTRCIQRNQLRSSYIFFPVVNKVCAHNLRAIENPAEDVKYLPVEKDRIELMKGLHRHFVQADDVSRRLLAADNTFMRIASPLVDGAVVATHMPLMGDRGADMIIEHVEEYLQTLK